MNKNEMKRHGLEILKSTELRVAISTLAILVLILIIASWRARRSDLKADGWADRERKNAIWAARFWKDIYLFRFNRSITARWIEDKLLWLEQKYQIPFAASKECNWPRFLHLRSFIRIYAENFPNQIGLPKRFKRKTYQLILGVDQLKRPIGIELENIALIFVAGEPGSGKSALLRLIASQGSSRQNIYVVGAKAFDFPNFNVLENENANDRSRILDLLRHIEAERLIRKEKIKEANTNHAAKAGLEPLILIVDEAHLLLRLDSYEKPEKSVAEEIMRLIKKLIRVGRAYGIITVIATQKAKASELDIGSVRDGVVICGKLDTRAMSEELFDSSIATSPSLVRGIFVIRDQHGVRKFKGYYIHE